MAKKKKTGSGQYPLRLPADLRSRIEKAATGRGVSINAEILERLERSFEIEKRLGGPKLVELVEMLARVMKTTGEHAAFFADRSKLHNQGEWLAQPYAFDQARSAVNAILDHFTPPGNIVGPPKASIADTQVVAAGRKPENTIDLFNYVMENFGAAVAAGELMKREQDDE